jgi:chromosome segregation ATPase
MGATASQCTDGWWFMTEQSQLQERVNALEQKCATADASYGALQSKCSEVDHRCEQLQIQVNGSRTEMQYILLQLEKVEQRMETLDLQLHAFIEDTDIVVLSSK